jgi:hypothetical protein
MGNEADVLCMYITGKHANEQTRELYSRAFKIKNLDLSGKEDKIWAKMFKHPYLIPFIDGGLAITNSQNIIRKRIFVMLAIAETQPEYSDSFLGPEPGFRHFFSFIISGVKALFYAVAGVILVKVFFRISKRPEEIIAGSRG